MSHPLSQARANCPVAEVGVTVPCHSGWYEPTLHSGPCDCPSSGVGQPLLPWGQCARDVHTSCSRVWSVGVRAACPREHWPSACCVLGPAQHEPTGPGPAARPSPLSGAVLVHGLQEAPPSCWPVLLAFLGAGARAWEGAGRQVILESRGVWVRGSLLGKAGRHLSPLPAAFP